MKKILLAFVFTATSFITLPAFSWPEVDHMNMCGTASKVVRTYAGSWQGWEQHDRYVSQRGNAYYFNHNCPQTSAPVVKAKQMTTVKKSVMAYKPRTPKALSANSTAITGKIKPESSSKWLIERSKRLVVSKRKGGYDKHADCERVDRMNNYGRPLKVIRRYSK